MSGLVRLLGRPARLVARLSWAAILANLLLLYVLGAVALRVVEPEGAALGSLSNYTWWFLVTITTVGYGDLTPASDAGRVTAAFIMLFGIGTIGLTLGKIGEQFIDLGRSRMRGMTPLRERGHVVLFGYRRGETERIVAEILADTHWEQRTLVLCSHAEVENPLPEQLKFVHGDMTADDTLARACVADADLIIIHRDDDSHTIVSAIAAHSVNDHAHIVARLVSEDSERHLLRVSPRFECVTPLAIPLVVQAIQDPGISRIVRRLTSNVAEDDVLYRVDVPVGAGEWPFGALHTGFKQRFDALLLGLAESSALDAAIAINPPSDRLVCGGMSLFYVASERLSGIDWKGFSDS